jgi:hypothetical protein
MLRLFGLTMRWKSHSPRPWRSCHAEGRGFEPLHPLLLKLPESGGSFASKSPLLAFLPALKKHRGLEPGCESNLCVPCSGRFEVRLREHRGAPTVLECGRRRLAATIAVFEDEGVSDGGEKLGLQVIPFELAEEPPVAVGWVDGGRYPGPPPSFMRQVQPPRAGPGNRVSCTSASCRVGLAPAG